MNLLPITNQGEDEQKKRNQQKAGCFRGIYRVTMMLVRRIVWDGHGRIVALRHLATTSFSADARRSTRIKSTKLQESMKSA